MTLSRSLAWWLLLAVYAVALADSQRGIPKFAETVSENAALALGPEIFQPWGAPEQAPFILGQLIKGPGGSEPPIIQAICRQSGVWDIVSRGNLAATLAVGVCDSRTELPRRTINDAIQSTHDLVTILNRQSSKPVVLRGYPPEHERLRDGSELDYFPVLLVGHGVGVLPTIILTPPAGDVVLIVQFEAQVFCNMNRDHRICSDDKTMLRDLAQRLAARLRRQ
jgi:hypothetical protein